MKLLQTAAIVTALGMSSVIGYAAPEAATEEVATEQVEYVAEMTGVT